MLALAVSAQPFDPSLNAQDFVTDFNKLPPTFMGNGGEIQVAPSIPGSGVTLARVTLKPGGLVNPHIHPRATATYYLLQGELRVCFAEELGGRTICNDLKPGQGTFIPLGTLHYVQNFGNKMAVAPVVLSSDNPGTMFFPSTLFTLPLEALSAAFNSSIATMATLRTVSNRPPPVAAVAKPADTLAEALAE